jgi:hypothetical protein
VGGRSGCGELLGHTFQDFSTADPLGYLKSSSSAAVVAYRDTLVLERARASARARENVVCINNMFDMNAI